MRYALAPGLAALMVLAALPLAAQQSPDTLDLRRIFSATDSVHGAPLVDPLPDLMQCPQFDARNVRGDATTFGFERRPVVEENMPPIRVTIEFVVGTNGRIEPRTARVIRASDDRLNRSIEYWVMDCRFHPGKVRGQAVRIRMQREWELRPTP